MRILRGFERALTDEGRRPELTTILSGPRGIGKTTLLAIVSESVGDRGWLSVDTTARPGMLDDIEIQAMRKAAHLLPDAGKTRLSGIGIPGVVELDLEGSTEKPKSNWRSRMADILDVLDKRETGLLITVDEVDPELDELEEFVTVYQHFVREGRRVALVMAGFGFIALLKRICRVSLSRPPDWIPRFQRCHQQLPDALADPVLPLIEEGRDPLDDDELSLDLGFLARPYRIEGPRALSGIQAKDVHLGASVVLG